MFQTSLEWRHHQDVVEGSLRANFGGPYVWVVKTPPDKEGSLPVTLQTPGVEISGPTPPDFHHLQKIHRWSRARLSEDGPVTPSVVIRVKCLFVWFRIFWGH